MPSNGVGKFRIQALWSEGVIVKSKINTENILVTFLNLNKFRVKYF